MLSFRKASLADVDIYFNWVNDFEVREQSFNTDIVEYEIHKRWFEEKIIDQNFIMLIFQIDLGINVGQIRIQKEDNNQALISISVSKEQRGKGIAKQMLRQAVEFFHSINPEFTLNAFIKETNFSSKHAFENAGFEFKEKVIYRKTNSCHYTIKKCK